MSQTHRPELDIIDCNRPETELLTVIAGFLFVVGDIIAVLGAGEALERGRGVDCNISDIY